MEASVFPFVEDKLFLYRVSQRKLPFPAAEGSITPVLSSLSLHMYIEERQHSLIMEEVLILTRHSSHASVQPSLFAVMQFVLLIIMRGL